MSQLESVPPSSTELRLAPPAPFMSGEAAPARGARTIRIALLLAILALAAGVRLHNLGSQCIWYDESLTLQFTGGGQSVEWRIPRNVVHDGAIDPHALNPRTATLSLWSTRNQDIHPPLYLMTVRVCREIFGDGLPALRGLPAFWSVVSVALLYLAAEPALGAAGALMACLLMALSGTQIMFAQEIRPYSMLTAFTLATCVVTVRIGIRGATFGRLAAFAALAVTGMLLHYYAAPVLVALSVALWFQLDRRGRVRLVVCLLAATAVYAAAWGPFVLRQRGHWNNLLSFVAESGPGHVGRCIHRFLLLPIQLCFKSPFRHGIALGLPCLPGLAVYLLPALAAVLLPRYRAAILPWWLLLVLPATALVATDVVCDRCQLAYLRYTQHLGPAIFVIVCSGLAPVASGLPRGAMPPAWRFALPVLLVALFGAYMRSGYAFSIWEVKPDYRPMAAAISQRGTPDDVMVVVEREPASHWRTYTEYGIILYYARQPWAHFCFLNDKATPQSAARLAQFRSLWVLSEGEQFPPLLQSGWACDQVIREPQTNVYFRHLRPRARSNE